MSAPISATFIFTPAVPGGSITATGATFSDVKASVLAQLAALATPAAATAAAIAAAQTAVSA